MIGSYRIPIRALDRAVGRHSRVIWKQSITQLQREKQLQRLRYLEARDKIYARASTTTIPRTVGRGYRADDNNTRVEDSDGNVKKVNSPDTSSASSTTTKGGGGGRAFAFPVKVISRTVVEKDSIDSNGDVITQEISTVVRYEDAGGFQFDWPTGL